MPDLSFYEKSPNGACATCRICGARTFSDDAAERFHHLSGCPVDEFDNMAERIESLEYDLDQTITSDAVAEEVLRLRAENKRLKDGSGHQ